MDLNGCNMYNDFYKRISVDSLCGNNVCIAENRLEIAKRLGVRTIDLEGKKMYREIKTFL